MKLLRRPISASVQIPDRFCLISMEFLSLSRRRSSSRNVSQRQLARRNVCRLQAKDLHILATSKTVSIYCLFSSAMLSLVILLVLPTRFQLKGKVFCFHSKNLKLIPSIIFNTHTFFIILLLI